MDEKKRREYSPNMRPGSNLPGASSIKNNPTISILAYCAASISMTIINKFCVSGNDFNLNFFFLAVQVILTFNGQLEQILTAK